jgi:hypothetical protein
MPRPKNTLIYSRKAYNKDTKADAFGVYKKEDQLIKEIKKINATLL